MADRDSPLKRLKIKSEDDFKSKEEDHSHKFILQYKEQYDIHCDHPQTVLEAITSKPELQKDIMCSNDQIILQKGKADKCTAIATHFPCVCLKDKELVTLKMTSKQVESRAEGRDDTIYSKESYYFIYIQTKGGKKTTSKKIFKSTTIENYTQLCVYGTDSMTLKHAIERDGRFVELGDFRLEGVDGKKLMVFPSDYIRLHNGKKFRISLPIKKAEKSAAKESGKTVPQKTDEAASRARGAIDTCVAGPSSAHQAGPSSTPVPKWVTISDVLEKAKTKQDAGSSKEVEKIYELLRAQFPELKKILESRFPGEALNETLKKVDFGKAQQTFSEVGRARELFEMGDSVCKITVGNVCEGTGFVLFKRYVLTNAHLFNKVMYNNSVRPDIDITAMFNYETPHQTNTINFKVRNTFIDYDKNMDYAVLELVVSEEDERPVPPGLMKHCCPMPESGEACIVGHPNGEVKMFDPTCIIEKENRIKEVNKHLQSYDNYMFTFMSIEQILKGQGIERILSPPDPFYKQTASYHTFMSIVQILKGQGIERILSPPDPFYKQTASYHTCMYHGSSGSPVFDANCRVFGLHTAGFTYGFGPNKESVIEYARPLLLILQKFVKNLETKNTSLLNAVKEELKGHPYRTEILTGQKPRDSS